MTFKALLVTFKALLETFKALLETSKPLLETFKDSRLHHNSHSSVQLLCWSSQLE